MANSTLFSDFLKTLGVPHTAEYSDSQYKAMPFQSMFGLSKLLESYGIPNEGLKIADKTEVTSMPVPFLADTGEGFVIVTSVSGGNVQYLSQGEAESMPQSEFIAAWNGIALLAYPTSDSKEPGYPKHRFYEMIDEAKRIALAVLAAALVAYLFVANKIYDQWSAVALAAFNIVGLTFTFMLMQKTLKLKSKAGDAVCGVLEAGGCDSILELKASSFFGIFKWSEVGFTYFTVSLLTLLIFPEFTGYLALCNACCLPFTVWSIWYQKYRAKVWCTLCVSVQTTLWLLFFCYLFGGWYSHIFPLRIEFFVLVATYAIVLLGINRFDTTTLAQRANETDQQAQS